MYACMHACLVLEGGGPRASASSAERAYMHACMHVYRREMLEMCCRLVPMGAPFGPPFGQLLGVICRIHCSRLDRVLSLRAAFRSTFWAVTRGDLLFRVVASELHACALFRARFDQLLGVIYEARRREHATRRRPKFPTHASP